MIKLMLSLFSNILDPGMVSYQPHFTVKLTWSAVAEFIDLKVQLCNHKMSNSARNVIKIASRMVWKCQNAAEDGGFWRLRRFLRFFFSFRRRHIQFWELKRLDRYYQNCAWYGVRIFLQTKRHISRNPPFLTKTTNTN